LSRMQKVEKSGIRTH
jgi:hypothetical protein